MTRVLVVNHAHSAVCGVHDLGVRLADRLGVNLDVVTANCGSVGSYNEECLLERPDAVIFNYRADLMPWAAQATAATTVPTFAILHNYEPDRIDGYGLALIGAGFDYALALDPDIQPTDDRIIPISRPLPWAPSSVTRVRPPRIGAFGFAFPHKQMQLAAREVDETLDEATFVLHCPEAYFNGAAGAPLYAPGVIVACDTEITKPGITMEVTTDHVSDDELVGRLARNDVNCLLYAPGQPEAGLSSALDFLIAAQRPILVTDCAMFRHARGAAAVWPQTRLGDVLDDWDRWQVAVDAMYVLTCGEFDDVSWLLDRLP